MFFEVVVKVREIHGKIIKSNSLQFKMGDFVKFRPKSVFSPQGWFFVILSVLEPNYAV